MVEYACKDIVFHFNKKHLEDSTIPMWVLKTHGETFYVQHVDCSVPWSTKETPDNAHTKGSIKVKDCLLLIDDENCATIKELTLFDKVRLRNQKLGITRIQFWSNAFANKLKDEGIKHSPFRHIVGACGTDYTVCDLLDHKQVLIMQLKYAKEFRVLAPNETLYKAYDDRKLWTKLQQEHENESEWEEETD